VKFGIEATWLAGLEDLAPTDWWEGMSKDTIKGRLHGWKLWEQFCREKEYLSWACGNYQIRR
jgi:hypothetical protein